MGLKESVAMAGKYTLHGNSQRKWSRPEPEPGDRIVIARIAQIEKAKDLLVDE